MPVFLTLTYIVEDRSHTSRLVIQRKGRSDDLKSFDEMEKMTSEPEEIELPQNQDEEQTSGPEAQSESEAQGISSFSVMFIVGDGWIQILVTY